MIHLHPLHLGAELSVLYYYSGLYFFPVFDLPSEKNPFPGLCVSAAFLVSQVSTRVTVSLRNSLKENKPYVCNFDNFDNSDNLSNCFV